MCRALKSILVVLLLGQTGLAQPQPSTGPAPGPGPAPPAGAASEADIQVRQRATLSAQDMLGQARHYRTRMEEVLVRHQSLVEQARKQRDIIRLNCILDK